MKKNKKERKRINIFKIVGFLIKACVIIFMVLFAIIICLQRFSNNSISIFNYRMFSVASGSMAPRYNIGDVILCKDIESDNLKVGDDVTYLGKSGTFKGKIVTHRIIKIEEKNGERIFYTKGIASTRTDPAIKEDQIYGKIVKRFDFLSWLYKFIITPNGFYICIFIPLAILLGSEIVATTVEKYEKKIAK